MGGFIKKKRQNEVGKSSKNDKQIIFTSSDDIVEVHASTMPTPRTLAAQKSVFRANLLMQQMTIAGISTRRIGKRAKTQRQLFMPQLSPLAERIASDSIKGKSPMSSPSSKSALSLRNTNSMPSNKKNSIAKKSLPFQNNFSMPTDMQMKRIQTDRDSEMINTAISIDVYGLENSQMGGTQTFVSSAKDHLSLANQASSAFKIQVSALSSSTFLLNSDDDVL